MNGTISGEHGQVANRIEAEEHVHNGREGSKLIPPAQARSDARQGYINKITVPLNDTPAWTPARRLRVAIIGAGYSGMIMAQKLQHKYRDEMSKLLDFVIYEARSTAGGTWDANTYPGVRCDVPSMIYCFPFETNPEWNNFFSTGGEIQKYFVEAVKKWRLEEHVKFEHRVVDAQWVEEDTKWRLKIRHGASTFEDQVDLLISARGFLSTWRWPQIPGIHDFQGKKVHSADWDHTYDYSHKRIAVIGNGSSGIQILPEMANLPGATVTSFQRGPTWIVSRHQPAKLMGRDDPNPNPEYLPEEKERLRDPAEMKKYRKNIQGTMNKNFRLFSKGSAYNAEMTEFATKQMAEKLNHDSLLCEKLIPKYELGCRRITPGSGYLEAFTQSNVHLTNSEIIRISAEGIHTEDGTHHLVDVM